MVGSGNFGSALTRILGQNALENDNFDDEVKMWVFEEKLDGKNLSDIINEENENVKYFPGAKFTPNVVACPDIAEVCRDATLLAFCLPHQFLKPNLGAIKKSVNADCRGLSAIKGIDFDQNGLVLISDLLRNDIGIDTSILMGANVAKDMAHDHLCETTIGFTSLESGHLWRQAFNASHFQVGLVADPAGVELCGALKNIVAMGAGFCDGLGYGGNTKAAVIRIGLKEMVKFCQTFYSGVKDETFLESCGVADLITTCYGGRNRLCAEAFAAAGGEKDLLDIEAELLAGQKLQGALTAKEVNHVLRMKGIEHEFPLFTTVYQICYEEMPADNIAKTDFAVQEISFEDVAPIQGSTAR